MSTQSGNDNASRYARGAAAFAARSERFMRNDFFAIVPGGSSLRKCTPSTRASVVTTSSSPGGGAMVAASSVNPNAPGAEWESGAKSCAISSNSPGLSELELVIGRRLSEFHRALAMRQLVEHRIDEGGFVGVRKRVRHVEIFVDHHFRRNVLLRDQLVSGRP